MTNQVVYQNTAPDPKWPAYPHRTAVVSDGPTGALTFSSIVYGRQGAEYPGHTVLWPAELHVLLSNLRTAAAAGTLAPGLVSVLQAHGVVPVVRPNVHPAAAGPFVAPAGVPGAFNPSS